MREGVCNWFQVGLTIASPHHSLGVQVPPCAPALPPFSGLPITLHLPPPNFFSSSLPSPGVSDHHRGSRKTALGLRVLGGVAGRGVSLPPHSPATLVAPLTLSPGFPLTGSQGPSSSMPVMIYSLKVSPQTPNLTLLPDHPLTF